MVVVGRWQVGAVPGSCLCVVFPPCYLSRSCLARLRLSSSVASQPSVVAAVPVALVGSVRCVRSHSSVLSSSPAWPWSPPSSAQRLVGAVCILLRAVVYRCERPPSISSTFSLLPLLSFLPLVPFLPAFPFCRSCKLRRRRPRYPKPSCSRRHVAPLCNPPGTPGSASGEKMTFAPKENDSVSRRKQFSSSRPSLRPRS